MKLQDKDCDKILDDLLSELNRKQLDEEAVSRSAQRAWSELEQQGANSFAASPETVDRIRSCDDIQSLIPAYLADALVEAEIINRYEDSIGDRYQIGQGCLGIQ